MIEYSLDPRFTVSQVNQQMVESFRELIADQGYFDFISALNGGFFYEGALQLYSFSRETAFQDIEYVNGIFRNEYGKLAEAHIIFGQDALGNQFSFVEKGIAMFNCETAEMKLLAGNFKDWMNVLSGDVDYLTARPLLKKWIGNYSLDFDQRLCAKIPFVLGGEFDVQNLYAQYFPNYLSSNANLARQIHDLPDGAQVNITVTD